MSLDDPKKALSAEGVLPLVHTGPYELGRSKPSDSTIRFRNESKKDKDGEKKSLKIYDTAGETKVHSQAPHSSRRRL